MSVAANDAPAFRFQNRRRGRDRAPAGCDPARVLVETEIDDLRDRREWLPLHLRRDLASEIKLRPRRRSKFFPRVGKVDALRQLRAEKQDNAIIFARADAALGRIRIDTESEELEVTT